MRIETRPSSMSRFALRTFAYAVAHFLAAAIVGIVARGWDLDQLTSRSGISRAAAAAEPALWVVHSLILGSVPTGRISEYMWVIPLAIVANSLAYGLFFAITERWIRRRQQAL
jgi:hypothetical protein